MFEFSVIASLEVSNDFAQILANYLVLIIQNIDIQLWPKLRVFICL